MATSFVPVVAVVVVLFVFALGVARLSASSIAVLSPVVVPAGGAMPSPSADVVIAAPLSVAKALARGENSVETQAQPVLPCDAFLQAPPANIGGVEVTVTGVEVPGGFAFPLPPGA